MKRVLLILFIALITQGCVERNFNIKQNSAYLPGDDIGVILAHGRGKHPTWKVVDPIRKSVNRRLGFAAISVQMPVAEDGHWKGYADTFDEAELRIKDAIKELKSQGISKVYLVGHSMGSRMSAYYASKNSDIQGVVIIGCRNNGGYPLDCSSTISDSKVKVLDIYGTGDWKDVDAAKERKYLTGDNYQQVAIDGAGHRFDYYESELIGSVIKWIQGN